MGWMLMLFASCIACGVYGWFAKTIHYDYAIRGVQMSSAETAVINRYAVLAIAVAALVIMNLYGIAGYSRLAASFGGSVPENAGGELVLKSIWVGAISMVPMVLCGGVGFGIRSLLARFGLTSSHPCYERRSLGSFVSERNFPPIYPLCFVGMIEDEGDDC